MIGFACQVTLFESLALVFGAVTWLILGVKIGITWFIVKLFLARTPTTTTTTNAANDAEFSESGRPRPDEMVQPSASSQLATTPLGEFPVEKITLLRALLTGPCVLLFMHSHEEDEEEDSHSRVTRERVLLSVMAGMDLFPLVLSWLIWSSPAGLLASMLTSVVCWTVYGVGVWSFVKERVARLVDNSI